MGFLSSIFGSNKSSSSSSTTSNVTDARVAGDNGAFVVGQNSTVDATTPEAFETAIAAIDSNSQVSSDSLSFGENIITGVGNLIIDVFDKSLGSITNSANKSQETAIESLAFADTVTRSDATKLTQQLIGAIPWVVVAGIAYGVIRGK